MAPTTGIAENDKCACAAFAVICTKVCCVDASKQNNIKKFTVVLSYCLTKGDTDLFAVRRSRIVPIADPDFLHFISFHKLQSFLPVSSSTPNISSKSKSEMSM